MYSIKTAIFLLKNAVYKDAFNERNDQLKTVRAVDIFFISSHRLHKIKKSARIGEIKNSNAI